MDIMGFEHGVFHGAHLDGHMVALLFDHRDMLFMGAVSGVSGEFFRFGDGGFGSQDLVCDFVEFHDCILPSADMVSGQDLLQGLFDVSVFFQNILKFMEVALDGLPVIVVLFCDIDTVPFGGLVIFLVQKKLFIELLAGAQTAVDNFFPAGAVEADHLFRQVFDFDRLSHVQDEELSALGNGYRLENQGSCLGDRHEKADDVRMGDSDRSALFNLLFEDGNDRSVGAQDVSEADRHEFGFVLGNRGDDDLRQALAGAHDVGGVHRLVGGDQDKAPDVALRGHFRGLIGAKDVVQDCLLAALLHEGHVLVGGGVDDNVRLIPAHDPPEGFLIPDGAHLQDHGIGHELSVLLFQFEEEVVHVVLGDIVKDKLFRGKGQDLAAELGSDGSASAGDHDGFAGEVFLNLCHVQVLLRPTQKVGDVHFPGLRAFTGARIEEHMQSCSDTGVQEVCDIPLRGSYGDDDLIDVFFFYSFLDFVRSADNRNPGNLGMLSLRIVIQNGHGGGVAVPAVLNIPDHGGAGIAGSDDQDAFGVVILFADARGSVADQEPGSRHQGQGDHPLDEIDRARHEHQAHADGIFIRAVEQRDHQGNEIGESCAGQGGDYRLKKGIRSGVFQDGFIDAGKPEGKESRCQQDRQGPQHLGHTDRGNSQGEIEGDRYQKADTDEQNVQYQPYRFLFDGSAPPSVCSVRLFQFFLQRCQEPVVVLGVADGQAEVVFASGLAGQFLDEDVVLAEEGLREGFGVLCGFRHEVVGLGRDHAEVGELFQFLCEALSFGFDLLQGALVVLLVLLRDLQVKLSEGVDVPDGHILFDSGDGFLVSAGQDAEPEARNAVGLGDALHDKEVRVVFQGFLVDKGVVFLLREVREGFVQDEGDALFFGPADQLFNARFGNVVAAGVVRVHQDQVLDFGILEILDNVFRGVGVVFVIGGVGDAVVFVVSVGVFLESGADEAGFAFQLVHEGLDELRRAVAHADVLFVDAEVLCGQEAVDILARGILGQEGIKAGLQFVLHLLGREVGVHQVAEVQHPGIAPVAAVALLNSPGLFFLRGGEKGLGDVQVLLVVDLIPGLACEAFGADLRVVQHGDDPQHLLIVLVLPQGGLVGLQEGNVVALGEGFAELVDIDGLVIPVRVAEIELLPGHKAGDLVLVVQGDAGAVHPGLIFVHQGQGVPGIGKEGGQDIVLKNDVGLEEDRVLFLQVFPGQGQGIDVVGLVIDGVVDIGDEGLRAQGGDIVLELLSLIPHHDDDPGEVMPVNLAEHPLDQGDSVDLHHALGVVFRQFLQALAHACRQYHCLH